MRVTQQTAAYQAERIIGTGRKFASVEEMQRWVDDLRDNRWWHAQGYSMAVLRIEVHEATKAMGDFAACSEHCAHANAGVITVNPSGLDEVTGCHEVAHILARAIHGKDVAGHGPEWAAIYLVLVSCVMGAAAYVALQESFDLFGVDYDVRSRAASSTFAL